MVDLPVNATDNVDVTLLNCTDQDGRINLQVGSQGVQTIEVRRRREGDYNIFSYGLHTIYCDATDAAGLTASCNFTVDITGMYVFMCNTI